MSVLIKGMEMPTKGEYHMTLYVCGDGAAYVDVAELPADEDRFEAAPVPPHGRLGDLDKLVEKIDGIWDCNDMVFKPDDHCCNIPEDCKGCKCARSTACHSAR